jgi:hypothetical protein
MNARIAAALATLKGRTFNITELSAAFQAQGMNRLQVGFACNYVWTSGAVKWNRNGVGKVADSVMFAERGAA